MLRRYSTPVFCSRTCRLATIAELGAEYVRSLGLQNIRDLHTLVKWNAQNGIFFMRMSSEMFPFASHPELGYTLEFADAELKAVGKTAPPIITPMTRNSQPRSMPMPCQMEANTAIVSPKMPMQTWLTKISCSGDAVGFR